jgi:hypothetical protein
MATAMEPVLVHAAYAKHFDQLATRTDADRDLGLVGVGNLCRVGSARSHDGPSLVRDATRFSARP